MTPPAAAKRVFRLGMWIDPVFEERRAREPGVELVRCPAKAGEDAFLEAVSTAPVYHTSSAKDENPRRRHRRQPGGRQRAVGGGTHARAGAVAPHRRIGPPAAARFEALMGVALAHDADATE